MKSNVQNEMLNEFIDNVINPLKEQNSSQHNDLEHNNNTENEECQIPAHNKSPSNNNINNNENDNENDIDDNNNDNNTPPSPSPKQQLFLPSNPNQQPDQPYPTFPNETSHHPELVPFSDKPLLQTCQSFVSSLFKDYIYTKFKSSINENTYSESQAKQFEHYLTNLPQIIQIQKNWKRHYDIEKITLLKEKTFYIQRAFRNYLIKKYNLPTNFYYNDKFMRIQNEIFENNYKENLTVLFPALFLDKSDINSFASNMLEISNNPTHNPYETGKIHLFGKILDFDMMIETDECYETLWGSIFDSIYTKCLKNNSPIQLLALGGQHTLCVNNKGKIYTFGWNNYGQCGVPVNSTIINKNDLNNNYLVEVTKHNELKPKIVNRVDGVKIPEIDQIIMSNSIACGEDHSLILDQDGSVWAFGLNLNGQLGLGHSKIVERPTKITTLNKHFITSVKSEGNINFAISNKGEAFMWPWNDKGNIQYTPRKFTLKQNEKVSSISCGNNFVIILSSSGMVYSMGRTNKFGQLGHGDFEPRLHPSLIQYFVSNSERITQISCGYKHCIAKSACGRVYTWGMGCKGQLGLGTYNNLSIPSMVKFGNVINKVYQVSAGFRCSFFLCENRKIYACGCNGTISMEKHPVLFDIIDKVPEMSLEQNYSVVRILNTWNKSFSVFYATVADCANLKMSPVKLNNILNQLASKWDYEGIDAPYIESIAGYFPITYMKKPKDYNSGMGNRRGQTS